MKNYFLIILVILLILTIGCSEKTKTVNRLIYVCYDGSTASKIEDCPREEIEKIKEVIIERYVCWNGNIVNNSKECPVLITSSLATTTTSTIVTSSTTIITTTTTTSTSIPRISTTTTTVDYCQELGCPSGTKFVASSKSDKYHYCDCEWARKIKEENLVCYTSVKEAQDDGKEPCGVCGHPG